MARTRKEESVGIGEAKSHFSELVERVRDESAIVTITRHGKPVARIVPVDAVSPDRHLADARGWLEEDDPFLADLESIERARHRQRPRPVRLER